MELTFIRGARLDPIFTPKTKKRARWAALLLTALSAPFVDWKSAVVSDETDGAERAIHR